ncbi:D-2-hydroxyacid dehydrogenase family protein [Granulosicoccus antarcticus]|uniref:Hydroxypyruvate reductase n=1 Tax=Granulosicoccus antarcticus IMCC3135 TaxID=1192854 RepID=A0A2Z2NWQ1_9GAMM|nr:D-2-hydroxyacid dehydrogenase family protein [Granulosicoccus antarcticus]ASJ74168.1 Hydroxypyruvate reductase [Granulosicoccus antarcticus IMCC3135]
MSNLKIAVLDDSANASQRVADWSVLNDADVTVFTDTLKAESELIERLRHFDVVCLMRERTPFPASLIKALPKLKLIITTGPRNLSIDMAAAAALHIPVCGTESRKTTTSEFAMLLMLTQSRGLLTEVNSMRETGWQSSLGRDLAGLDLGLIGLGKIGEQMATLGKAFGMTIHAWSPNLTTARCESLGVQYQPDLSSLMANTDIVSVHMVLSERSTHLVNAAAFASMRNDALFINTSRGQIVDQQALLDGLHNGKPLKAALDVYDEEPLPMDSPLRDTQLTESGRLLLSPHLGYVTEQTWKVFYSQTVDAIAAWQNGAPIRQLN